MGGVIWLCKLAAGLQVTQELFIVLDVYNFELDLMCRISSNKALPRIIPEFLIMHAAERLL